MPYLILFILLGCPGLIFLDYHKQHNIRVSVIYIVLFFFVMALLLPFLIKSFGLMLVPLVPLTFLILLVIKHFADGQNKNRR